jgi:hypothetical protein
MEAKRERATTIGIAIDKKAIAKKRTIDKLKERQISNKNL